MDNPRSDIALPNLLRGPFPTFVVLFVLLNAYVASLGGWLELQRRGGLMAPPTKGPTAATVDGSAALVAKPAGPPRYDESVGEELSRTIATIPDATKTRLTVLSTMSQGFVINDKAAGDQLFIEIIDDAIAPKGGSAWAMFAPNLCNEEVLLQIVALTRRNERTPAVFLHGLCFDKYRNADLRSGYRQLLVEDDAIRAEWAKLATERKKEFPHACSKMSETLKKLKQTGPGDSATFASSAEAEIRRAASAALPLVRFRADLNAYLQGELFKLRNAILHIKPTSKRPVLPERYGMNLEFLRLALALAREHDIEVLLYIVPLNPQGASPYLPEEYEAFKKTAKQLAGEFGAALINLEDAVPADAWGEFMGGPDFKHFRGAGHRAAAKALLEQYGDRFVAQPSGRSS